MTTDEILSSIDKEYELARTDPEEKFLKDVANNALYWAKVGGTPENVASGVTFSLLAMIDGSNLTTPPIDLAYSFENDEAEEMEPEPVFNATSQLHEQFYPVYRDQAKQLGHVVDGNEVIIVGGESNWRGRQLEKNTPVSPEPSDVVQNLFDTMPALANLTDKQKQNIRKSFETSSKKLNKAVQALATDLRTQMDCLAVTVEHHRNEIFPKFKKVVPKDKRVNDFIENCVNIAEYWGEHADTPAEAAEGVVGSMLAMLDGGGDVPALDLIPAVLPELVADYNESGSAGWPAEPINDDVELKYEFTNAMRARRAQTATIISE